MKKWLTVFIMAIVLASVAGCGQGGKEPDKQGSEGSSKEKMTINMMTVSYAGGGWPEDHPVIKEINKKMNIEFKVQWVPSDTYPQKLNVMAASNEFPDVFFIQEAEFNKWRDKGIFMDVKPELDKYPNLSVFPEDGMAIMNPKDKYYGFPYYVTDTRDTLAIRQDWLDKLKLNTPTTVEEFYEVAKAFATQDPDDNGIADTSGFSFSVVNNKFSQIEPLMGAFGLANEWYEEDGQLIPMQVQAEELKAFAEYMNKAYREGVLDKDFMSNKLKDSVAKLEAGKTGIAMVVTNEFFNNTLPTLKKLTPDAELVQLFPPKGPTGIQATQTLLMTNKIVINNKLDAAKKQRILELLDYLVSDEGYDLIKHGLEGVHYKKENDDKYVKLENFDKDRPQLLSTWFFRRFDPGIQIRKWDDQEYANNIKTIIANNEKYRLKNPAEGLASETFNKKGAGLQQKWMETMSKVIVGQLPLTAVDDAVAAWKRDGGDEIIKEINEQYQLLK
ncbi:extracellular solute-binding protein [Paenibacillus sp. GXUN7292]|uniref:extracellular solute-binding protein n=1 Tax=Paenibacillus sp. GXUN7292 TaxID=3422499 RepID=UPI003D7D0DD6